MKAILFTTKTCPNCRIATKSLEKAHISYELVDAEENEELVKKYGIMQAPTLVVVDGDGVKKMANASNIKAYAENNKEQCRVIIYWENTQASDWIPAYSDIYQRMQRVCQQLVSRMACIFIGRILERLMIRNKEDDKRCMISVLQAEELRG